MTRRTYRNTLLLFDIDGTLITSHGSGVPVWKESIMRAFSSVYSPLASIDEHAINGMLERGYFKVLADQIGISDEDFRKGFPKAVREFTGHFTRAIDEKRFTLVRIDDAYECVRSLSGSPHISLGLLTGNNEPLARHKLRAVGFDGYFAFGAYGTEHPHRGELVKRAIRRASRYFSVRFSPRNTVVIGDTKHDIMAAAYAGAVSVGVTTGLTDSHDDLVGAGADLVVDSLLDPRVLQLIGWAQ